MASKLSFTEVVTGLLLDTRIKQPENSNFSPSIMSLNVRVTGWFRKQN